MVECGLCATSSSSSWPDFRAVAKAQSSCEASRALGSPFETACVAEAKRGAASARSAAAAQSKFAKCRKGNAGRSASALASSFSKKCTSRVLIAQTQVGGDNRRSAFGKSPKLAARLRACFKSRKREKKPQDGRNYCQGSEGKAPKLQKKTQSQISGSKVSGKGTNSNPKAKT